MIKFIKEGDSYFLQLGFNFITKTPKRIIPVSREAAAEFASKFNEEFATHIGNSDEEWSFESFKLTNAPDHPFGWTDSRRRTILHYNDQSWHMIAPEIAEIGKLAQSALNANE
jgi:hypothetical protein